MTQDAVSESFFGPLKAEWVPEDGYDPRDDGRTDLFNYIEGFYNRERRHSTINYPSPVAMEAAVDVCQPRVHEIGARSLSNFSDSDNAPSAQLDATHIIMIRTAPSIRRTMIPGRVTFI